VSSGGIQNSGTLNLISSTVSRNIGDNAGVAGIRNSGTAIILNSTISQNGFFSSIGRGIGGLLNTGQVKLQNTILAGNVCSSIFCEPPVDCNAVTSLGHNIIGDPTGCTITFQPSDLTGDPGLAAFMDDGAPGHGRFPLLPSSPAINTGNDAACPPTDQLRTPRNGPCDIGAVEFYLIVNDLVALGNLNTAFDPRPVPGGPAGSFLITAQFTNTSNHAIIHPFVEVVELSGGNLLLNADGGAGGVGARVTLPNNASTTMELGASSIVEFLVGLQTREPFTFLVNVLGEARTSNTSVSLLKSQSSNP
jgi:hypothetical protein